MTRLMFPFLIAVQFLTILPIRLSRMATAQENARSVLYYPLVGGIIGGILWGIIYLCSDLPTLLLSFCLLFSWVILTGGLHLDGLADTADAWVGGFGDPERTLTIMKDPTCGSMGVISLILCLLAKWVLLYSLLPLAKFNSVMILLAPILGRLALLVLLITTPYVRQGGLASTWTQHLSKVSVISMLILTLLLLLFIFPMEMAIIYGIFFASVIGLRRLFIKRIQGITGDTLGASVELVEVITLFSMVCILLK